MKHYLSKIALMAVVSLAGIGVVSATEWDKKTIITTDEAMQLPTTTLPPGTYVIRLADSDSNRHIVRFFDKDEKHVITTIQAIPNERVRPTGKSVFAFWEVPAGQPKALRAWFYPGDNFGQEFAYHKQDADRIAASNNHATVPVGEYDAEASKTETAATTAPAAEPAPEPAPVAEPAPAPAPVEVAAAPQAPPPAPDVTSVEVAPAPAPVVDRDDARKTDRDDVRISADRLPKTASNMPLFGLIGLLAVGAALALRVRYNIG